MNSHQDGQHSQKEVQVFIKALQDSNKFSQILKEQNEKLISENNYLKKDRELNQNQIEQQKKTILLLTEQNKQIQQKLKEQEKMFRNQIQELNDDQTNSIQLNQTQKQKQQNNRIQNDSISMQDEISNENKINLSKNLEINRSINDKLGNGFIGNGYNKFPEVQKQDHNGNNGYSNNIHSIYNNNLSPHNNGYKLEKNHNLSTNSSNINLNENQNEQKYNVAFSRQNQNGINPNTASQQNISNYNLNNPYKSNNQQSNLTLNNNFVFQATEENKNISKNIEQLKLNESSLSTSNSRLEYSPNNRYNGGIAGNMKRKYEQNLLKASQSSNILSSFQSSSPLSKQSISINNQDYSGQFDSSNQRKQVYTFYN